MLYGFKLSPSSLQTEHSNASLVSWWSNTEVLSITHPRSRMHMGQHRGKTCYGHYLSPTLSLFSLVSPMVRPPSQLLKDAFSDQKSKDFSDSDIQQLAKTTLLPPEEVCMWLEHLKVVQHNRRRGAAKASATRRLKKSQDKHFCICGEEYLSLTDEVQNWIGCDSCSNWFHFECVGISST